MLQPMIYSGFEDVLSLDLLYYRTNAQTNNFLFYTILVDKNCNDRNALDFLYVGIKSRFILDEDIFVLEKNYRSFLRKGNSTVIYETDLSLDQYKDLFDLLLLGAFADAEDMVRAFENQY